MKRIDFKQISPTEVEIIGIGTDTQAPDAPEIKLEIGCIFTPSGTSQDCIDCIQVCGFEEAFDLWGCGRYQKPKVKQWGEYIGEYIRDKNGKREFEYVKDIQLKFDWETHCASKHDKGEWAKNCHCCFNEPCTCEVKTTYENPYTVKREQDISVLKDKKEKKK